MRLFRSLYIVSMSLLLCCGVLRVQAASFVDTAGTPFAASFDYLLSQSIITGYPDGSGRPLATLNRVEALKVVMGMRTADRDLVTSLQRNLPSLPLFGDIDQRSWYAVYVEAGFQRGIVKGYPDATFKPSRSVTVEEAIALLLRAYGQQASVGSAELSPYIENHDGQWYTPYVNAAIKKNLLMHYGRLHLGTPISRGQFFDIAYRLHSMTAKGQLAFSGAEPQGPTVPTTALVSRQGSTTINVAQPVVVDPSIAPYASQKYFAISMPSVHITDLPVIHPTDPFTSKGVLEPLTGGVGHLFSFPGGGGKVMIYGHSSGYAWDQSQYTKIFRKINELATGDRIYVTYNGKLHVYEVTYEESVPASDTSRFNDNGLGEELILYTCWPPDSISQRYLVHAVPVKTVALR